MACHPSGITVDVVGIYASNNGRSCEKHLVCGEAVVAPDVVLRFRSVQVKNEEGKEEPAIAAFHVTGGVDGCRVGFLRRHLLRYKDEYDGRLAQVIEVLSATSESPSDRAKHVRNKGCCQATLIEAEYRESPRKKARTETSEERKDSNV